MRHFSERRISEPQAASCCRRARRRELALGAFAAAALAVTLALATSATAQAAPRFKVCADVPWNKPSLDLQAETLGANERWSEGDQQDPSFSMDFPFDVRVLSSSISYDMSFLGGAWTLSRQAARTIGKKCPQPGGKKQRMLVLRLRGWKASRASRDAARKLVISASPAPGRIQTITFRGLGGRNGFTNQKITLVPEANRGCYISHIPVKTKPDTELEGYRNIQAPGIDCAEVESFVGEYNRSEDLEGEFAGFDCTSGLIVYGGVLVTCEDQGGRVMRFAYYYPTMFEDQNGADDGDSEDPENPDGEDFARFSGQARAAAARCGSATLEAASNFEARNITATGMSCSTARRELLRGGVGAHGYQRYGGWSCRESSGLRYRCSKGYRSFAFRLIP